MSVFHGLAQPLYKCNSIVTVSNVSHIERKKQEEKFMTKLYYQFPNTWFGDCMPFGKGDQFYLFHQRDTRKPCPFGEPFGWDLAVTSDFVHYEDKGTALPRGTDEEQDQFIFAGSVFEAEGKYHIFYTGFNRDYPKPVSYTHLTLPTIA